MPEMTTSDTPTSSVPNTDTPLVVVAIVYASYLLSFAFLCMAIVLFTNPK